MEVYCPGSFCSLSVACLLVLFLLPHEPCLQTIPKHLQLPGFPAIPVQLPACHMSTHCVYCIHAKARYSGVPSAHCLQIPYSSLPRPGSSLGSAVALFWSKLVETRSVWCVCVCVRGATGELCTAKRQLPSVLLCGDPALQAEVVLGRGWLSGNHACKKHPLHSWEKTACS